MKAELSKQLRTTEKTLQGKIILPCLLTFVYLDKINNEQRKATDAIHDALGQLQQVQKDLRKQGKKKPESTTTSSSRVTTGQTATSHVSSTPATKLSTIEDKIQLRRKLMWELVSRVILTR